MAQAIFQHTFDNGLTLLGERMEHVRSAALNFHVPAGSVYDPPDQLGIGNVLAEMLNRGAGQRDSRELTSALDNLGVDRSESVGTFHMQLWGATIATNLMPALEIYADILRRPQLPEGDLEAVRSLALQDIRGLEDEPRSRVMVELRNHLYPDPLSHDYRGTEATVEALTMDQVRKHCQRLFTPRGTILSVTGNISWDALLYQVQSILGDWEGEEPPAITYGPQPEKRGHVVKDLEQTHLAVAFGSVPISNPEYYQAIGAVNVLSGNMGSRLFTEIREKEGLCYSVGASYRTLKDRGNIVCYAGSRTERAQRTLDLMLHELRRLQDGIEQDEVDRVQAGLKSSQIMQQESTSARAISLSSDWYHLGRVRSFDEIQAAINSLTPQSIVDYLHRYPAEDFTIVTLGSEPLTA